MGPAVVDRGKDKAELEGVRKRIRGFQCKTVGHQRETGSSQTESYQGPRVWHRAIYSILCNNLYGKRIWKGMDICW